MVLENNVIYLHGGTSCSDSFDDLHNKQPYSDTG